MKKQTEQPKMYRLINGQPYEDDNIEVYAGEIYRADFTPSRSKESIQYYVDKFPQDWQLVEPEKKPFTPTHINTWSDTEVMLVSTEKDGSQCTVRAFDGEEFELHKDDIIPIPTKTHLSESQYNSLIKAIAHKMLWVDQSGDMEEEAQELVREWAEVNNIQLP